MSFHSYSSYLHGLFCSNFTVYSFHENVSSYYHAPGSAGRDAGQEENFQAPTVIERARAERSLAPTPLHPPEAL
jgi:hypothetical protein